MSALSVIFTIFGVQFCAAQLAGSFDYPQSVTLRPINNGIQRYPDPNDSSLKLDHGNYYGNYPERYPGGQLPGQPRYRRQNGDFSKIQTLPAKLPGQPRNRRDVAAEPEEILAVPIPQPLPEKQPRNRRDADEQPENILAVPIPQPLPEKQPRIRRDIAEQPNRILAITVPQLLILSDTGEENRERRQAIPIPHQLPSPNPDIPQKTTF